MSKNLHIKSSILCFLLILSSFKAASSPRFDHLWIWEDTENDQKTLLGLIHGYEKLLKVNVGAVIIDSPWAQAYNNFIFDKERYPDHQKVIDEIKDKDIGVVGWITPYINNKGLKHDKFEEFTDISFKKKIFKWWKGEGYLIDFSKQEAYERFFYQKGNELKLFNALKVDAVAQFQPYDEWRNASMNWSRAAGKYAYDNNIKILQRGVSHQNGLQSTPRFVDWNWGGDYTGRHEDGFKQINDLCQSIAFGFESPAFEIGGYNPPAANANTLYKQIIVGSIFPVAILGGKNWEIYFDLIKSKPKLISALKLKEQLAEILSSNDKLICNNGYLKRNNIYVVYEQASIPVDLVNFENGEFYEMGYPLPSGVYIPTGIDFCPRSITPFLNKKMLNINPPTEGVDKCFNTKGWHGNK